MIDVGEGLAVLVDNGDTEVLIDGGYAEYGRKVSDYIKDRVDGSLDYIIATHSHADHVGGLTEIIKEYDVNHVIYGDKGTSKQFNNFQTTALNEPGCDYINREDETIPLGSGMNMTIFDVFDEDRNTNNNSIVTLFNIGGDKVLATGDAEDKVEEQLLGRIGEVDILIVGHHGSETSSSQAFLDELQPDYGLISSAGPDFQYNNPDEKVMRRLTKSDIQLFGTYVSGNIVVAIEHDDIVLSPPKSEILTYNNFKRNN
jgi:beta-lactamase superfamily II metal-dependent hydrolase